MLRCPICESATERAEYSAALTGEQAQDLLDMSPTARHLERTPNSARPSPGSVTLSVLITDYQPRRASTQAR